MKPNHFFLTVPQLWSWHFYVNSCSLIHEAPWPLTLSILTLIRHTLAKPEEIKRTKKGNKRVTTKECMVTGPTRKFGNG